MRIWPVNCENRTNSGTRRVYLGARVPAGQRRARSVRWPVVCRLQTVTYQYISPLDRRAVVTLSACHVCAERSRLTGRRLRVAGDLADAAAWPERMASPSYTPLHRARSCLPSSSQGFVYLASGSSAERGIGATSTGQGAWWMYTRSHAWPRLCGHSGQKPRARPQPARTGRRPSPASCGLARYSSRVQQRPLTATSMSYRPHPPRAGTAANRPAPPLVRDEETVPVACPIDRSTPGTHGHSRTAWYTSSPAY